MFQVAHPSFDVHDYCRIYTTRDLTSLATCLLNIAHVAYDHGHGHHGEQAGVKVLLPGDNATVLALVRREDR